MRKKRTLLRVAAVTPAIAQVLPAVGQSQYSSELSANDSRTQQRIINEYPELRLISGDMQLRPGDQRAHFFASAKLLRLADLGKTQYGTALIQMEQVRWEGLKRELSDRRLTPDHSAWRSVASIIDQKIRLIVMIDDLVMNDGLDDAALVGQLNKMLSDFDAEKSARQPPTTARNYLTAYGKVMMQIFHQQKQWLEKELSRQGFSAVDIQEHPVIQAFDSLDELSRLEDRQVYACGLDQKDLLANLNGIVHGLSQQGEVERQESFKQALQTRGQNEGLSVQDFYKKFLADDPFATAMQDLPKGVAEGRISATYMTRRYVVSTNLPQESHTILASENVRVTYRPMKDEPWMGVVSIGVKVGFDPAFELAQNLFDMSASDPANPENRERSMIAAVDSSAKTYSQVVNDSVTKPSRTLILAGQR